MATRSIRVKLAVKRDEEGETIRRAIWETHRLFNEGVAYYMRNLLLMRGEVVKDSGITDPKWELKNILKEKGVTQEADKYINDINELYKKIVLSSEESKGNAQSAARNFLSILVAQSSIGGMGKSHSGRKPKWKKLQERNDPNWEKELEKYEERKRKDEQKGLLTSLKDNGILPLFKVFLGQEKLNKKSSRFVCTGWDRDMFQQAIERLLSWETWDKKVKYDRRKLEEKVDDLQRKYLGSNPEWARKLREYETNRKQELDLNALPFDHSYRILTRSIRGWKQLREKWIEAVDKSEKALWQIASELQAELRGGFGDPDLFKWLCKDENQNIWNTETNNLSLYVKINELEDKLERKKSEAQYTPPDAIVHPLWARHDSQGGNVHSYELVGDDKGIISKVKLKVLFSKNDKYEEKKLDLEIAKSNQLKQLNLIPYNQVQFPDAYKEKDKDVKMQWVEYTDLGNGKKFYGSLGGAKLRYNRKFLEKYRDKQEQIPKKASIFFEVSLKLYPTSSKEGIFKPKKKNLPAIDFDEKEKSRLQGCRVMSVDMGLRAFATCSVFEVKKPQQNRGLFFQVKDTDLYAVHERSFVLRLPGEETDKRIDEKREELRERWLDMRAMHRRLSHLLSLAGRSGDDRKEKFEKLYRLQDSYDESRKKRVDEILQPLLLSELKQHLESADDLWKEEVIKIHKRWEEALSAEFHKWRSEEKGCRQIGGISYWWIEHLTEIRKLLNAWSCHAREPGEIVRSKERFGKRKDEKAREVDTDKRLLEHINNLKEDRHKKGADALIMAALGYVYNYKTNKWEAKYSPCDLILFEDLSRYLFRTDRPKRENSQLMKWGHRAIPQTVLMQGELFDVRIGYVGAGFTSRFHAKTGAPGIRCKMVIESDIEQEWFIRKCLSELHKDNRIKEADYKKLKESSKEEILKEIKKYISPGKLIPWSSGELFATKGKNGKPLIIHADINAAQNLQRRFWTRYADTIRLSCKREVVNGVEEFIPKSIGKRVEKSIGFGKLIPAESGNGFRYEKLDKSVWKKLSGVSSKKDDKDDNIEPSEAETIEEEITEITGDSATFFSDPSGLFFPKDRWYESKIFWGKVKQDIAKVLDSISVSQEEYQEDEEDDIPY